MPEHKLRYGNNPHQKPASFITSRSTVNVLNGEPSYINLLDVLTGWQIVRDLWSVTGTTAAASMKHCVPVGVATPGLIDPYSRALLGISEAGATTSAYLRARSSDWGAAYGDLAVIFGEVNEELAYILSKLVSDGIAATGFTRGALRILREKRKGKFLIVQLAKDHEPPLEETREILGVRLNQRRNTHLPDADDFKLVVGSEEVARRSLQDLALAAVSMKYTVSNNIVVASAGRTLSISAGQQSRILSTKLACYKFDQYSRLQHPDIVNFVRSSVGTINEKVTASVERAKDVSQTRFESEAPILLSSDGFIPFKDNIEEARKHRIEIVCEPEGAMRSSEIESAVGAYGMTLVRTRDRFFYH